MGRGRRAFVTILIASMPSARPAFAHTFSFTDVHLRLTGDARFAAEVTCDLDALAVGVDASVDSAALAAEIAALAPSEREQLRRGLQELLKRQLRVRFDGMPAPFDVVLPGPAPSPAPTGPPSALGVVARLEGAIPAGAKAVSFFASRAFPPVRLSVLSDATEAKSAELLAPGEESRPFYLAGPQGRVSTRETGLRFLGLGFSHIVPLGLDHILFVLGLALLSPALRPLAAQVTAFTLAHTASLGLSVYGVLRLSPRIVEPLIALSIVYVAVENILTSKLRGSRLALVFGFGLLHGLGFAGALAELGWPEGRRLAALLAFNLGVELGQITVVAGALGLVWAWTRAGGDRRRLVRGASGVIAAVGAYWAIVRILAP